jgi:catechol 2,3-dioxygenase-like lactoylglutathione lyase family enzyme
MKLVEIAKFTNNATGMIAFYRGLLGADPVAESPDMAIFLIGEIKIFIHKIYEPGPDDLQPENHLAFEVEDIDETCSELQAKGITMEIPPHDYYWGRSAYLRDPDRLLIEIIQAEK